jgi:mannose-6-phosphate isomerase-like protein (cupin superfamily)
MGAGSEVVEMTEVPLLELRQRILDANDVANLPQERLHPGVTYAVLWREAGNLAGLMWVRPGAVVPPHVHERATHHVWLVDGRARVDDRTLGFGSYWHVPPGVSHHVEGLAPYGCQLFYLYLRTE